MSDEFFGKAITRSADFILDETPCCICVIAHGDFITSVDALEKETDWHPAEKYGQTVVEFVSEIRHLAAPTTADHGAC